MNDYTKYQNINIDKLKGFFSSDAINFLHNNNIDMLGKLFELSDKEEFIDIFIIKRNLKIPGIYLEIIGSVKLLKFHYFGVDLLFDEDTSIKECGFSSRVYSTKFWNRKIRRANIYDLYKYMRERKLKNIDFSGYRSISTQRSKEINLKLSIIYKYYYIKEKNNKKLYKNTIDHYKELQLLINRHKLLTEQIKRASEISKIIEKEQYGNERKR